MTLVNSSLLSLNNQGWDLIDQKAINRPEIKVNGSNLVDLGPSRRDFVDINSYLRASSVAKESLSAIYTYDSV
ncbi:hypothetical protein [Orenia marismortui]|uniref:Uncharacterized protein n=1 Tax=Orenia marismortui TaxID=46469 RepID=A0A4R8H107_9FIRM|nr:hypothetical protein [Orenia marismortui]TDX53187.1 hypothetical protein C7959_10339 [Orenia marismortui]